MPDIDQTRISWGGVMTLALLCTAAMFIATAFHAQVLGVPDERVYQKTSGGFELSSAIRYAVLDDPEMRAEIRRTGLAQACPKLFAIINIIYSGYEPQFRPLKIAAVRKIIPADVLADRSIPDGFDFAPMVRFKAPVREELDQTAGEIFSQAKEKAHQNFAVTIKSMPNLDLALATPDDRIAADSAPTLFLLCGNIMWKEKK